MAQGDFAGEAWLCDWLLSLFGLAEMLTAVQISRTSEHHFNCIYVRKPHIHFLLICISTNVCSKKLLCYVSDLVSCKKYINLLRIGVRFQQLFNRTQTFFLTEQWWFSPIGKRNVSQLCNNTHPSNVKLGKWKIVTTFFVTSFLCVSQSECECIANKNIVWGTAMIILPWTNKEGFLLLHLNRIVIDATSNLGSEFQMPQLQ